MADVPFIIPKPSLNFIFKGVNPVFFCGKHDGNRSEAFECTCDEVAETGQKIDAHARMKSFGVSAANGQKTDLRLVTEWHQGRGANLIRALAEQKVPLRIAHLPATWIIALQKRIKGFQCAVVLVYWAKKPANFYVFE